MESLVGKVYIDPISPKDPNGKQTFSDADLPNHVRIIRPGQPITEDFKPNRLNVHLNENDVCISINYA